MKAIILIVTIVALTEARSISKREACFPFCGMDVPTGITQSCQGANCKQNNGGGVKASQTCQGGNCDQSNAGGAAAVQTCTGANCGQKNANGAAAAQNCEDGNCDQTTGGGGFPVFVPVVFCANFPFCS